jgi:hypothetical protein
VGSSRTFDQIPWTRCNRRVQDESCVYVGSVFPSPSTAPGEKMATPPHQVSPEEQQQLKLFSDLVPGILVWWKTSSRGPHRKEDPPLVFLNGTVHPLSKHFGPRRLPTTPVSSLSVVLQQRRHDAAHTMRPQRGICGCSGRCTTVLCLCRRQEDDNTKIFGSGMRQDNDQGKPPILQQASC